MELPVARGVDRLDLFVGRKRIAEGARVLDELGHPTPPVEIFEDFDYRFALGLGLRKAHGIPQFIFGNINGRLRASTFDEDGTQVNRFKNLKLAAATSA